MERAGKPRPEPQSQPKARKPLPTFGLTADDAIEQVHWAVKKASQRRYESLEPYLAQQPMTDPIHDTVARVAVCLLDAKLLDLTKHHPRQLIRDFAGDPDGLRFSLNAIRNTSGT